MGDTAGFVITKGHIDNPFPNETFMLDLEVLPLPMNISKTNRVKASAKAEALTPLDLPVPDQTSFSMALTIPIARTNTHLLAFAAVTDFSFKWIETDKPVDRVKLVEPPP